MCHFINNKYLRNSSVIKKRIPLSEAGGKPPDISSLRFALFDVLTDSAGH
jgi:hypothetical protein